MPHTVRTSRFGAAAALAFLMTWSAMPSAGQQKRSQMEITLERREGTVWKAVDPSLVLEQGDAVRFRFKSNIPGYLYVTNYGTSGQYTLLFPRVETGQRNLIQVSKEYLVPATEAQFRVSGPAGFESVFWLLSPVALGNQADPSPARPADYKPPVLRPRCDETSLRARGVCLDTRAGPRAVSEGDPLPGNLRKPAALAARELTIVHEQNQSVVSPSGTQSGPILCEFRLAHK
jgi:hypothetical protein